MWGCLFLSVSLADCVIPDQSVPWLVTQFTRLIKGTAFAKGIRLFQSMETQDNCYRLLESLQHLLEEFPSMEILADIKYEWNITRSDK